MSYAEGLADLRGLLGEVSTDQLVTPSSSESDTRAKVITRVLTRVLGWPEHAIQREPKSESGYIDYLLKCPHSVLVVEAKRYARYFSFPIERDRRSYAIETLRSTSDHVGKAVRQARQYADDNGIEYACATNGAQWIVFRAITRSHPWTKADGIVFRSLEDIEASFTEFWNLLSFDAVQSGALRAQFTAAKHERPSFARALDGVLYADNALQRNRLSAQLHPIINGLFRDLTDAEQAVILRQCYVVDRKVQGVSREVTEMFHDVVPGFAARAGFQDLVETDARSGALDSDFRRAVERGAYGSTVLLLGGVGCGKTTFIHRFFKITAKEFVDKHCLWFYVPFTEAPLDSGQFGQYLRARILAHFRQHLTNIDVTSLDALRRVYAEPLRELVEGIWSALPAHDIARREADFLQEQVRGPLHCDAVLRYLRSAGAALAVVLDNVDQRDPTEQVRVFLLAHELCRQFDAIVIVALREESYFRAEQAGAFNAYHNVRYHIASPEVRKLLAKRVEFTLAASEAGSKKLQLTLRSGVEFDANEIAALMRIVKDTALKENPAIVQFFDAVSHGNMRSALDMFNQFLVSGSTNVEKMLMIYRQQGHYNVAEHEVMKAVMLGDFQFYKDSRSPICNLFEVADAPTASNLTAPRLLYMLDRRSAHSHPEGQGFVSIEDALEPFVETFGDAADASFQLGRLVGRRLVESDSRQVEGLNGARFVRITACGKYFLHTLVRRFQYLDLVALDTPCWHKRVIHELKSHASDTDLYVRIERVEWFLRYLDAEEKRSVKGGSQAVAASAFGTDLVRSIERDYAADLHRIVKKAALKPKQVADIRRRVEKQFAGERNGSSAGPSSEPQSDMDGQRSRPRDRRRRGRRPAAQSVS